MCSVETVQKSMSQKKPTKQKIVKTSVDLGLGSPTFYGTHTKTETRRRTWMNDTIFKLSSTRRCLDNYMLCFQYFQRVERCNEKLRSPQELLQQRRGGVQPKLWNLRQCNLDGVCLLFSDCNFTIIYMQTVVGITDMIQRYNAILTDLFGKF